MGIVSLGMDLIQIDRLEDVISRRKSSVRLCAISVARFRRSAYFCAALPDNAKVVIT
jgi:hypothetical protein